MNLRNIDLNLLVVLQKLLQERHVSKAAERLHMSQPAVSRALQRLRAMFNDPLLVHTSQGYDLSARANQLLPQLNLLLEQTKNLITGPIFDPKNTTQVLKFYGPDPDINWFLPPLFKRIRQLAPNITLEIRSDPQDHFHLLETGKVHFAISAFQPNTNTSQLHGLKLGSLDFALVMSADNPLAQQEITIEKYIKASHGVISLTGKGNSLVEQRLIAKGYLPHNAHLHIPLRLSSFTAIASFCEYSDIIFHLPKHFAKQLILGRNLVIKEVLPEIKPEDMHIFLYWHERYHKDAMCEWVRGLFKK